MKLGDRVTHPAGYAGIVARIIAGPHGIMVNAADWPDAVVIDLGFGAPSGRWLSITGEECDRLELARMQ